MVTLLSLVVAIKKKAKPTETQPQKPRHIKLAILIITLILVATLTAGIAAYYIGHQTAATNNNQQSSTSNQQSQSSTSTLTDASNSTDSPSLSTIYQETEPSVVVIQDFQTSTDVFNQPIYSQVQGSGFTYNLNGQDVIITNYHVVDGGVNVTVTFQDGNTYTATGPRLRSILRPSCAFN